MKISNPKDWCQVHRLIADLGQALNEDDREKA